jgi:two-component system, LytTR family, response regulator
MLRTIIIDDEQPCIETLQLMLAKKFMDSVTVIGSTTKPLEGIEWIEQEKPDLVFLDIEMPELTGIELLHQLSNTNFQLIFTTAHEQYALQAIKLNALDYLIKPISLDELTTAIEKCKTKQKKEGDNLISNFLEQLKSNAVKKIAIPTGTTTQFVPVNEIVRAESQSNYSTIYFTNRPKQVITKTLKELEEQLTPYNFFRVHHSHLVNLDHVIGYKNQDSGYIIMHGNEIIEISRRKKQEVMQKLNAF